MRAQNRKTNNKSTAEAVDSGAGLYRTKGCAK